MNFGFGIFTSTHGLSLYLQSDLLVQSCTLGGLTRRFFERGNQDLSFDTNKDTPINVIDIFFSSPNSRL